MRFFVSGWRKVIKRGCATKKDQSHNACEEKGWPGLTSANVCVCKTDFCNSDVVGGAAMTSSCGHVIMAVALIVGLVFSRLM